MLSNDLTAHELELLREATRIFARAQHISVEEAETRLRKSLDHITTPIDPDAKPVKKRERAAKPITYVSVSGANREDKRTVARANQLAVKQELKAIKQTEKREARKARKAGAHAVRSTAKPAA